MEKDYTYLRPTGPVAPFGWISPDLNPLRRRGRCVASDRREGPRRGGVPGGALRQAAAGSVELRSRQTRLTGILNTAARCSSPRAPSARRARQQIVEFGAAACAASNAPPPESGAAATSSTTRSARPSRCAQARAGIGVDAGLAAARRRTRAARRRGSRTSLAARLRPLAPVGGTMWAASPARNRRPKRIGSATKLRSGATLFSIDGPVTTLSAPSGRAGVAARPRTLRPTTPRPVVQPALQVVAAARHRAHGRTARSRARGSHR